MPLTGDDSYKIVIQTTAEGKGAKDVENSLKDLGNQTDKGSGSFLKMSAAVATGEAAFNLVKDAIQKVGGFLGDTVKSANDSENAMSQLVAVLKSTGHAAGLAEDQLSEQASALQKVSTYSDEAIQSSQALLLTFTNIKGKVFTDAIPTILDMSTALGQDLKSSSIQVGKALNDPIKGITALSRVGVSFTQQQKDTIKSLVDTGKTAEAQKVILSELNKEFGGSSLAASKTFAGSMEVLKNQFDDVKESIGRVIVKGMTPFISKAAEVIGSIDWESALKKTSLLLTDFWNVLVNGDGVTSDGFFGKVERIAQTLRDVGLACKEAAEKIERYLSPKFEALFNTLQDKVLPQLDKFWHNVIEPLIPILGTIFVGAIGLVVDIINTLIDVVVSVSSFLEKHTGIVVALVGVFGSLAAAMALGAAFDAITVGFATLTLVTIPSFMASISAAGSVFVAAFPFALVIAGIVLIGVEIAKVIGAYGDLQKAQAAADKSVQALNSQMDNQISKGKITLDQAYKIQNAPGYTGAKTVFYSQGDYHTGYASGGYTGRGGENDVAGIVHKGEFVLPQSQVDQSTGLPKAGASGGSHVTFTGDIYLGDSGAVDNFFKQLDRNNQLAARGLTTVKGM